MLIISLFGPEKTMLTMLAEAGFLTIPDRESTFPLRHCREQWYCFSGFFSILLGGITVAGTVSDSNRIPFYATIRDTVTSPLPIAKVRNFSQISYIYRIFFYGLYILLFRTLGYELKVSEIILNVF